MLRIFHCHPTRIPLDRSFKKVIGILQHADTEAVGNRNVIWGILEKCSKNGDAQNALLIHHCTQVEVGI